MDDLKGEKILYLQKNRTGAEGELDDGRKIIFRVRLGRWYVGTGNNYKAAWNNLVDLGGLGIRSVDDAVKFLGMELV